MKSAEAGFTRIVSSGRSGWLSLRSCFPASVSKERFQFDCPEYKRSLCIGNAAALTVL
ncbi:MAG: hypothetical protein ACL93V_09025 [Candidatus Electrothrix sp. YB6]